MREKTKLTETYQVIDRFDLSFLVFRKTAVAEKWHHYLLFIMFPFIEILSTAEHIAA